MLSNSPFLRGALTGALLFFPLFAFAQSWKDPQWLRLLHYKKGLFGSYVSEADDRAFFLHPEGKTSPDKELEAFLEALPKTENDPEKNTYCRFPARVRWLLSKRPDHPVHKIDCPKLEAFRRRVDAKTISVVFSSYYMNNPGSSFGHTFIRLGKKSSLSDPNKASSELLDTGINYGAMTEGAGAVLFAIGGIAGWFPGTFSAIPYYYKVREYNDYETRDLWSYQLDYTQDEVDLVVDHVWELGHIYFDYFFLTENCSQMVLTILEAARPSVDFKRHVPKLYVIPSDTLKGLVKENVITNVTYRPSASSIFRHQLRLLGPDAKKRIIQSEDGKNLNTTGLTPTEEALVLDTAISLVDFKYAKDILKQDERAQAVKRPLLIRRSKVPLRSPELDFSDMMKFSPHLGHGSQRLGLVGGQDDGRNFTEVSWRFAFHEMLDYGLAYPPRTNLDVVKFTLHTDGNEHYLKDLYLVDAMSLGVWDKYVHSSSWKFKLGHWQTRDRKKYLATEGVSGGYGYSYHFKYWAPFILAHGEASYVSEQEYTAKFAYGADLGAMIDLSQNLKFQSVLELRAHPWNEGNWLNEARISNKDSGLGLYYRSWLVDGAKEFGAKLFFYF